MKRLQQPIRARHADELFTYEHAAARLDISRWKLEQLIRTKELHAIRLGQRTYRIARTDLENFVERSRA